MGTSRSSRITLAAVAISSLIVAGAGTAAMARGSSERTVYTGCLNERSGVLTRVAIGSEPARRCASRHTQISWDDAGAALEGRIAALEERVDELEEPFGLLDLVVDCAAGDTVAGALEEAGRHVGPVRITISGVCEESIEVTRDDVSFVGVSRSDGISAPPTAGWVVNLFDVDRIGFENLTVDGGQAGIAAGQADLTAVAITVRGSSQGGIIAARGSSAVVWDSLVIDNDRFGIATETESTVTLSNTRVSGSGETGLFAGGVGSATIVVNDSEIVANGDGAGANPGGNLRISNTLVEGNDFSGVFAIGAQVVIDGASVISGNSEGVSAREGSVVELQPGPVIVEGNSANGITVSGGSTLDIDDGVVRNNAGDGIAADDLSTARLFEAATIVDNGGWGVNCAGPPAIAVLGGQGLFDPAGVDLSGNSSGPTNCQSP